MPLAAPLADEDSASVMPKPARVVGLPVPIFDQSRVGMLAAVSAAIQEALADG